MTDAEWATVRAAYKEEYGADLDQDNAAYQQTLQDACPWTQRGLHACST